VRLLVPVAGLVALDALGGGLAIATGRNTPAEAWSGRAVLAAPLPMVAVQVVLVGATVVVGLLATRRVARDAARG